MQQADWAVQLQDDERYVTILLVLRCINAVFKKLYRLGAWLDAADAAEIGQQGITALRGYAKLAKLSLDIGEPRYPLIISKVSHAASSVLVAGVAIGTSSLAGVTTV